MVSWRNTRLPKLEGENEVTSVFEMVINHTYELGFQYCSFTMSSQLPTSQINALQINNYPNEFNSLYKQAHFFDTDPVVAHCKRCVLPLVWEEKAFSTAPNLWGVDPIVRCPPGLEPGRPRFPGRFQHAECGPQS